MLAVGLLHVTKWTTLFIFHITHYFNIDNVYFNIYNWFSMSSYVFSFMPLKTFC